MAAGAVIKTTSWGLFQRASSTCSWTRWGLQNDMDKSIRQEKKMAKNSETSPIPAGRWDSNLRMTPRKKTAKTDRTNLRIYVLNKELHHSIQLVAIHMFHQLHHNWHIL
ncbi:hypothetical protein GQ457_17G023390 [Hibiscus cannabinus]